MIFFYFFSLSFTFFTFFYLFFTLFSIFFTCFLHFFNTFFYLKKKKLILIIKFKKKNWLKGRTFAFAHDVGHTVGVFVVDRALVFVVEAFDELFGGVAEETPHAVHDAHRIRLVVFSQKHLEENQTRKQMSSAQRFFFHRISPIVNLKKFMKWSLFHWISAIIPTFEP